MSKLITANVRRLTWRLMRKLITANVRRLTWSRMRKFIRAYCPQADMEPDE